MPELTEPVDVVSAWVLARYFVELTFANGDARVIDREPFLWGPMFEPIIEEYELFCQVAVDADAAVTSGSPRELKLRPRRTDA